MSYTTEMMEALRLIELNDNANLPPYHKKLMASVANNIDYLMDMDDIKNTSFEQDACGDCPFLVKEGLDPIDIYCSQEETSLCPVVAELIL